MLGLLLLSTLVCISQAFIVEPWLGLEEGCNSPKYWCKNKETAKECGVTEYCLMEWGKTQTTDIESQSKKQDAPAIKVSLYYESLCPGCRDFIHSQLYPAFEALNGTGVLDIELVPYGNAKEQQKGNKWVYDCQHGPAECYGNLIESCALHILENNTLQLPFIYCLEKRGPTKENAQYCAKEGSIDYTPIDTCVTSDAGNALQHQNALKTDALKPPHQYVPWITVDGVHTNHIQNKVQRNMLKYVCQQYKGTKPKACNHTIKELSDVCYRD